MKFVKLSIAFTAILFLTSCATGARMENMTYNFSEVEDLHFDPFLEKQISVQKVTGGKRTNPAWMSQISNENFEQALKMSLQRHGLYAESGQYKLSANLLKIAQPLFGLNLKVKTYINYQLIDSFNDKIIFQEIITAQYVATVADALNAAKRLRLANEGSGKENIKELMKILSKIKIQNEKLVIN